MPTAQTHVGELVSEDINHRFRSERGPMILGRAPGRLLLRQFTRANIKKVTIILPDGKEIELPVEARVIVEY